MISIIKTNLQLMFGTAVFFLLATAVAAPPLVMETEQVVVVYEKPLASAAAEVVRIYPGLKLELEELFGWQLYNRPQVVLVKDAASFRKLAGNNFFVAFAVPHKDLIVIDHSKMNTHPFSLSATLKHELGHLLLHYHIRRDNLPKWFDEGVCQWASDGIGEIFVNQSWSGLDAAVMAGRIIPLNKLTDRFPRNKDSLILAYEQSKSVINYIDRQYGARTILEILDYLKNGETIESALYGILGISLQQLEGEWHENLASTPRWLLFVASHLYAIIFFLAAVLTFFGFIRYLRRRRRIYEEWEDDDDEW